jgi:hypothetical protein
MTNAECGYIKELRQNPILPFTSLSLIFDQALCAEVFSETKTPVKNTIVTYAFSCTQLSDICKCLKANGDC